MAEKRRAVRAAALTVAVLAAFVAGVAVGVDGSAPESAKASGGPSGVLDEAAERISGTGEVTVDPRSLNRAAIEGMLASTEDRWAAYYSPQDHDELRALLAGHYGGLGLWLRRQPDGEIVVVSVAPGSPAARARARADDVLVSVAGRPARGRQVTDVVAGLRGNPGTAVTLELRTGRAAPRALRLTRTEVANADVSSGWLRAKVGRIRVSAFTRGVGRQVRADVTMMRAQHATGIVLDLRGNPGGLLDEAVEVAGTFLDGGTVVSYSGRSTPPKTLSAQPGGDASVPLTVLVDGGSASAAEVVAGALQDHRRAAVVGSRTYGKGSVQETFSLRDGSAIELTVASYRTPAGHALDGTGVTPDIAVPPSAGDGVAESRAVEVLLGLVADAGTASGSGRG